MLFQMTGGQAFNEFILALSAGDDLAGLEIQHDRLGALGAAVDAEEKSGHGARETQARSSMAHEACHDSFHALQKDRGCTAKFTAWLPNSFTLVTAWPI